MTPEHEQSSEWLRKAYNDLRSARLLISDPEPITDTACFHCQQAVEKTLKAYLVLNAVRFDKVHSMPYLLDLCEEVTPSIREIRSDAESLAPFAVMVRYPGDLLEIPLEDAREALASAEETLRVVTRLMPGDLAGILTTGGT